MKHLTSASQLQCMVVDGTLLSPNLGPIRDWLQNDLQPPNTATPSQGHPEERWVVEESSTVALKKGSTEYDNIIRELRLQPGAQVRLCKRVSCAGRPYRAYGGATNDGLVEFRTASGAVASGAVQRILASYRWRNDAWQTDGLFFQIQRHKELTLPSPGENPFSKFPALCCRLVEHSLSELVEVVAADAVMGQLVSLETSRPGSNSPCNVIMGLGRVRARQNLLRPCSPLTRL